MIFLTHRIKQNVLTVHRHVLRSNHRSEVFVYVYVSKRASRRYPTRTQNTTTSHRLNVSLQRCSVIDAPTRPSTRTRARFGAACRCCGSCMFLLFFCELLDDSRMHLTRCTFFWRVLEPFASTLHNG